MGGLSRASRGPPKVHERPPIQKASQQLEWLMLLVVIRPRKHQCREARDVYCATPCLPCLPCLPYSYTLNSGALCCSGRIEELRQAKIQLRSTCLSRLVLAYLDGSSQQASTKDTITKDALTTLFGHKPTSLRDKIYDSGDLQKIQVQGNCYNIFRAGGW